MDFDEFRRALEQLRPPTLDRIAPTIALSQLEVPTFEVPQFEVPKFEFPKVAFPTTALERVGLTDGWRAQLGQEMLEGFRRIAAGIDLSFRDTFRHIGDQFDEANRRIADMAPAARRLGEVGWTVPMGLPPSVVQELVNRLPEIDLDASFQRYYTEKRHARLKELEGDLMTWAGLAPWHDLLAQCFTAYRRRHYLVAIPALLLIFEGALAAASLGLQQRHTDAKRSARAGREAADPGIRSMVWASLEGFTHCVFRDHDFQRNPPEELNRHVVMHGRGLPRRGQTDCIRLFHALHSLHYYVPAAG